MPTYQLLYSRPVHLLHVCIKQRCGGKDVRSSEVKGSGAQLPDAGVGDLTPNKKELYTRRRDPRDLVRVVQYMIEVQG